MVVLSASANRCLNTVVWALPLVVAAAMAAPVDRYFLPNFAFLVLPQAIVLSVVMYFDLRQPELAVTAASLAVLPPACIFVASRSHGEGWFAELIALPGFFAGALVVLFWTRRAKISIWSITSAFITPLVGAALGVLLFVLWSGPSSMPPNIPLEPTRER